MTYDQARDILDIVRFPFLMDCEFYVNPPAGLPLNHLPLRAGSYMQVRFTDPDHPQTRQHGRKWLLSQWMTKSELVQTAFAACLAAVEHEVRESFTYDGEPVFGPHLDVDFRVESLRSGAHQLDVRDDGAWVAR